MSHEQNPAKHRKGTEAGEFNLDVQVLFDDGHTCDYFGTSVTKILEEVTYRKEDLFGWRGMGGWGLGGWGLGVGGGRYVRTAQQYGGREAQGNHRK